MHFFDKNAVPENQKNKNMFGEGGSGEGGSWQNCTAVSYAALQLFEESCSAVFRKLQCSFLEVLQCSFLKKLQCSVSGNCTAVF